MKIGIIGAGLAGAVAARKLHDAGHHVCVLEKSGGTGGRLSTRRSDVGVFDHGAQYLSAKKIAFQNFLEAMVRAGAASRWQPEGQDRPQPWYRGEPGMSGFIKPLLKDIEVRNRHTVHLVHFDGSGVDVTTEEGPAFRFDRLIVTCPAPQALTLIGDLDPVFGGLAAVEYQPCWTAMIAFGATHAGVPDMVRGDHGAPLGWLTRETAKRGQTEADRFTMQAGMDWSAANLERDKHDVAQDMLVYFQMCFGVNAEPVYMTAHRWRYAAVTQKLGKPFLSGCSHHIVAAGDGLLGGRAEAAFDSGSAAAASFLV